MQWTELEDVEEQLYRHMTVVRQRCPPEQWQTVKRALEKITEDVETCIDVCLDTRTGDLLPASEKPVDIAFVVSRHTKHLESILATSDDHDIHDGVSAVNARAWKNCGEALYRELLSLSRQCRILPTSEIILRLLPILQNIERFLEEKPTTLRVNQGTEENESLHMLVYREAVAIADQVKTQATVFRKLGNAFSEELLWQVPNAISILEATLRILIKLHSKSTLLGRITEALTELRRYIPD